MPVDITKSFGFFCKIKINLITSETIELPISFIVGISFITGSISGTILNINLRSDND